MANSDRIFIIASTPLIPAFLPLLIDAGIALRADEFLNFAANLDRRRPWEAREAYSQKLGTKNYYRGLLLSEQEFNEVKTTGIQSASIRNKIAPQDSIKVSIITQVIDRLKEKNVSSNELMSVTENFDVARSVPCSSGTANDKKVYVFALKLPVLSVFSTDLKKEWFEEDFRGFLQELNLPANMLQNLYFPAAMESFLSFQINVGEITGVDVMTSRSAESCMNILTSARESFGIRI